MKKIIYLLQIVLVLLTSCDSILEVDNLTKKDTSNFPSSPKDAESALAGCYRYCLTDYPRRSLSIWRNYFLTIVSEVPEKVIVTRKLSTR